MKIKFQRNILLYISIILFLSCIQDKKSNKKGLKSNYYPAKDFRFQKKNPDTVSLGKLYKNYLYQDTNRLDSIYKETKIDDKLKKREKFLFVYVFDNRKNIPHNIKDYNEDDSDVYISEYDNNIIEFYFSFKRKGWNKLVLITSDQLRFPVGLTNELRLIEDKQIYVDSIFVK